MRQDFLYFTGKSILSQDRKMFSILYFVSRTPSLYTFALVCVEYHTADSIVASGVKNTVLIHFTSHQRE